MIYKEQDGTSPYALPLLRYLRGPGKNPDGTMKPANGRARFLGGRGFGVPISHSAADEQLAETMLLANNARMLQASTTKEISKTTLHVTLSWEPGQTPSDEDMMDAGRRMADTIQMPHDQYMMVGVRHMETDHPHAHFVFSRRNTRTGRAAPDHQRRMRGWHFAVNHDRKMRDEHGIPIPQNLQWREDRAQAALRGDHEAQRRLLFKEGVSPLDGRPTVGNAVVRRTAIDQAAAYAGKFGEHQEAYRENWARANNLFRLRHAPETPVAAYTTAGIYRSESQIISLAKKLNERNSFAVDPNLVDEVAREMTLSPEQHEELKWSTRAGGFTITSGRAGAGKSRDNIAFRKVMERSGFQVRGTSTSNNVIEKMATDEGYRTDTLWMVNHQIEAYERAMRKRERQLRAGKIPKKPQPVCPMDERTVWAVDEGSQVSDPDFLRFLKHVERYNGKVKFIKGSKQTQAVERCGAIDVLESKLGSAKLTENWRNPAESDTWNRMHAGGEKDWRKVVDDWKKSGALKWDKSKDESFAHMVKDYMQDVNERPDGRRQGVAARNAEIDRANAMIQAAMREEGKLGGGAVINTLRGPAQFHEGDRVRLTQSAPDQNLRKRGVTNGKYGKIEKITPRQDGGVDVRFAIERKEGQQPRVFDLPFGDGETKMQGLRLGYFGTAWNLQGRETDKGFAIQDPQNNKFSSYVSGTRHGKPGGLSVYANASDTDNEDHLAKQLANGKAKRAARSYYMDDEERARLKATPYSRPAGPSYPDQTPGRPPTPPQPPPAPRSPPTPSTPPALPPAPPSRPPPPSAPPPQRPPSAPSSPLRVQPQSPPSFRSTPMSTLKSEPIGPLSPQPMPPARPQPTQSPQASPRTEPPSPSPQPPQPTPSMPAHDQNRRIFNTSPPPPPSHDPGPHRGAHR